MPSRPSLVPRSWRGARAADLALLGGTALLFIGLVLDRIETPGCIWDGTRTVDAAIRLAEGFRAGDLAALAAGYPLYHGELMGYLMAPFALSGDLNWVLLRFWNLPFNVCALVFTYFLVRDLFSRKAACLTVILLALHPTFIMGTKQFNDGSGAVPFFTTGCLLALERWWSLRQDKYLGAAAAFLGLGLGTFLWFVYFAAGLACGAAVFRTALSRRWAGAGRKGSALLWALAGLLPGLAPLAWCEFRYDFPSLKAALRVFAKKTAQAPVFDLGPLDAGLTGSFYLDRFFEAHLAGNTWFLPLLAAALLLLVAGTVVRREAARERPLLFLLTVFLTMWGALSIAPVDVGYKLSMLYPFPQLFIALAVCKSYGWGRGAAGKTAAAALLGVFLWRETSLLGDYLSLQKGGGQGRATDEIYRLADWLNCRVGAPDVLVADGFTGENLRLHLPREKLRNLIVTDYEYRIDAADLARKARNGYLIHARDGEGHALLFRLRGSLTKVMEFRDREPVPVYTVYRVEGRA